MSPALFVGGGLYQHPDGPYWFFTLLLDENGLPVICSNKWRIFREFRGVSHVYRIRRDGSMELVIADEAAEQNGVKSPPIWILDDAQTCDLLLAANRHSRRSQ